MPQSKKRRRLQIQVLGCKWMYVSTILPKGKICKATGGRIIPTNDPKKALYNDAFSLLECRRHAGDAEVREEPESAAPAKVKDEFDPLKI